MNFCAGFIHDDRLLYFEVTVLGKRTVLLAYTGSFGTEGLGRDWCASPPSLRSRAELELS